MKQRRDNRKNSGDTTPRAPLAEPDSAKRTRERSRSARTWYFRLATVFLVPLLALLLVEGVLRLAGYGHSTSLFQTRRIGGEEFLVENDDFSLRFFPPELARTPGPIRMKPIKPAGTYRIFILGESAAMGDPEPSYGAGRYLEALLRERYPQAAFEIINVAFTAINSHVILPIARECAAQQGDLWIVYMGNNEMVGPFGAATVFGPKAPPLVLVRLYLALQQTRLGQLLSAAARRLKPKASTPPSWGGMQMFLGSQVAPDSPRKESVYRNFRANLRDILRAGRAAGVKVLLNTVAVNLKDSPPFASLSSTNLSPNDQAAFEECLAQGSGLERQSSFAEAASRYERAAGLNPRSAEAQYRWGSCLLQLGDSAGALRHLQFACDLDTLPFRTDSRVNGIIKESAREAGLGVWLLDAAQFIGTNSPGGIPGQEMLYEHVHFNFDGNYRLALAWAEQAASVVPKARAYAATDGWASQEICERRIALTDWNRDIVVEGMLRRMHQPPLSAQANNQQRLAALQSSAKLWRQRMDAAGAARARELYLEAIQKSPEDHCLYENFASFLAARGDLTGALVQWRRVHELLPQDYVAEYRLGELLAQQGKASEAEAALSHAVKLRPFISDGWLELGKAHILGGKYDLALREITRARELRPGDADYAYQQGRALSLLNRGPEAIERFREAVQLNPDHWQAHDALGGQLGLSGNVKEARSEFARVIQLRPDYSRAHLNLGVALLKEGQAAGAAVEFREALRLEPTNSIAREYLRQAESRQ